MFRDDLGLRVHNVLNLKYQHQASHSGKYIQFITLLAIEVFGTYVVLPLSNLIFKCTAAAIKTPRKHIARCKKKTYRLQILWSLYLLHPYNITSCARLLYSPLYSILSMLILFVFVSKEDILIFVAILVFGSVMQLQQLSLLFCILVMYAIGISMNRNDIKIREWLCLAVFALSVLLFIVIDLCISKHTAARTVKSRIHQISNKYISPGPGLSWYLFLEVFSRFKIYFMFLLSVTPNILTFPIWYKLKHDIMLFFIFSVSIAIHVDIGASFFAYVIPTSIIAPYIWKRCYGCAEYFLFCGIMVTSAMLPIMCYKWLYSGTGNANYVYNQNLALSMLYIIAFNHYIA